MKKLTSIIAIVLTLVLLSACQRTINGLNQDINRNSDAINKAISS